jgi:hypothetical protein
MLVEIFGDRVNKLWDRISGDRLSYLTKELSMTNTVTDRSLLNQLHAYVNRFETPNSREDLLAIASSILTFQQKQGSITLDPDQAEALIQQVVNQFDVKDIANPVIDPATDELANEVEQWRRSLENQVLNTLNAYTYKFQPDQILNFPETISSILPLVESVQLHKSQIESLIQQVQSKFDLQTALNQVIGSDSMAIVQKLTQVLQGGNLEQILHDTLLENQGLINQTIDNTANSLITQIVGSDAVRVNINVDAQNLMIKQVTLTLNIMQQSSPVPSKSDAAIATQIDDEVRRFRESRQILSSSH